MRNRKMCGEKIKKVFVLSNKRVIIILLCMLSIFLCGIVIGYNIGLDERYKLMGILSNLLKPYSIIPIHPFDKMF